MDPTQTEDTGLPNATPPSQTAPPSVANDAGTAAPDGQQAADGSQPDNRDDKGRFRNPVQPRIDELTRAQREAQRERDYWRQRAEAAEQTANPPPPPPAKPTPDQFDTYDAFVEALTDWKADQKIDAKLSERDTRTKEQQQQEARVSSWTEREAAARQAIPDYDEVMAASNVPVTRAVEAELLDSPRGPELAVHLAKNPDVAERLNRLDARAVAREIALIEARLPTVSAPTPPTDDDDAPPAPAARTSSAPPPQAPRTTSAPPPAKPTGSGRSATVPLEKMGMDDYVAKRKEMGASWARR